MNIKIKKNINCKYDDYLDHNYVRPMKWYDCRTCLQGKDAFIYNGQQYACTSRKCTSKHCIIYQTQVEANIRKVNYYFLKPDYFITLKLNNILIALDWVQTSCLMKCFKKKLKTNSKSMNFEFKYEFFIEFDYCNKLHIHGIIKNYGNNKKQAIELEFQHFLEDVWNCSIANFKKKYEKVNKDDVEKIEKVESAIGSVYCKKIISVKGSAIYLSKGEKYIYKYNPVPEEFNTSKCHITSKSRSFLVKPKKELLKIYYENKKFFREWESEPRKNVQKNEIKLAMGAETKNPAVKNDLNDELTECETKETIIEDSLKEETISCVTNEVHIKKPFLISWITKILASATWGSVLIASLLFPINKVNFQSLKQNNQNKLQSDHNERKIFMRNWFLKYGFVYYQTE